MKSVLEFLRAMNRSSAQNSTDFYVVTIPTSYIDPKSYDMYRRLSAATDPLFTGTRIRQINDLERRLTKEGITVINLRKVLHGVPGTYLRFDTHWSEKGVRLIADYIGSYLLDRNPRFKENNP